MLEGAPRAFVAVAHHCEFVIALFDAPWTAEGSFVLAVAVDGPVGDMFEEVLIED